MRFVFIQFITTVPGLQYNNDPQAPAISHLENSTEIPTYRRASLLLISIGTGSMLGFPMLDWASPFSINAKLV